MTAGRAPAPGGLGRVVEGDAGAGRQLAGATAGAPEHEGVGLRRVQGLYPLPVVVGEVGAGAAAHLQGPAAGAAGDELPNRRQDPVSRPHQEVVRGGGPAVALHACTGPSSVMPPSTTMFWPTIIAESGRQRKATTLATSSAATWRPAGDALRKASP